MNKQQDEKVNGYTNIQTYRLCLVLDNEQVVPNPLERFFELVSEEEFEITDINLINWNEVIERYSDRLVEGYEYKHQVQRKLEYQNSTQTECYKCNTINTHNLDEFGFCKECLAHL